MRKFSCLTITLLCLTMTACGVSCAYSGKSKHKPAKVVVRKRAQIVDIGMQAGKEYVVRKMIDLQGKQIGRAHV